MPGINPFKVLAYVMFLSKQLKLPSDGGPGDGDPDSGWQQPEGDDADTYSEALEVSNNHIPLPPTGVPLFMPQNMNAVHTDTCNKTSADFQKFIDDSLDAVKFAVDLWKLQSKFKDLKVAAVCAIGAPDCLDGPELENDIKNAPSYATYMDDWKTYKECVAVAVSKCFNDWQSKVLVPGLPWYPLFAAFPSASAPPTPNIPTPMIAAVSPNMTKILMANDMKDGMIDELDSGLKDEDPDKQHEALFEAIATELSILFLIWLPSQQNLLVMGKGSIPSFAPPYAPVGPVVGGDNISAEGHNLA